MPITDARASRDVLQASGYTVDWNEYPIEHTVSPEEVERADDWIHHQLTTRLAN